MIIFFKRMIFMLYAIFMLLSQRVEGYVRLRVQLSGFKDSRVQGEKMQINLIKATDDSH